MRRLILTVLVLLFVCSPAAIAELKELRSLLEQKNYAAASEFGENLLGVKPDNQEALFLTAYALQMDQQPERAAALYRQMISSYPGLPEPRNNLAMILLQQEKYDEAVQLLVDALNTHPSYATSYRNLNEIYRAIASEAYRRAVSEPGNPQSFAGSIQLDAISQLDTRDQPVQLVALPQNPPVEPAQPVVEGSTPTAETESISVTESAAEPESIAIAEPAAVAEPSTPVEEPVVESVAVAAPEINQATPVITQAPQVGKDFIEQRILDWAAAWSSKEFARYVEFYAADFRARFDSHEQWLENRRQRINRPGDIIVEVSKIKLRVQDENRIVLDFEQRYESSNYRDRVIKRLVLGRFDNEWKITGERVLSVL